MRSFAILFLVFTPLQLVGQETPPAGQEFLRFVRQQAATLRQDERVPSDLDAWKKQRQQLREELLAAWGGFPTEPCDLKPQKLGEIVRDGYRVEKIIFQTRPDVWMTANAYVPIDGKRHPAVLCVHGHWRGAKQDPVVQSRCIGLVKHGFFVLVVDAFGAGERGVGTALGEYHGEMTGATLLPVGLPLSGLQVYENQRAVDYLRTREEVDGERIGITGASGGGNQSMYAGAWDERLRGVVPVCSVGTYESYLGAACCMCEVVPGALRFTEEWGLLALAAPRGLMVVNATRDAPQFSVAKAEVSVGKARTIFELYGQPDHLRHAIFESPHDYNREMREAMYGWMIRQLAGGAGEPIPEPEIKTEEPEALRCFPGESRPKAFLTIPQFAARESRRLLDRWRLPATASAWSVNADGLKKQLRDRVFGGDPPPCPADIQEVMEEQPESEPKTRTFTFSPEPGLRLTVQQTLPADRPIALVLDLDGAENARQQPVTMALERAGRSVVTLELRATGKLAYSRDKVGRAPDHNTAEWSLWIGRPLLGQWVVDVRRALDALATDAKPQSDVTVVGYGPAGVVALCAAALDDRIARVGALDTLSSYVTDVPYEGQRLGILAPGILRDVGDISHLAALVAPRRVVVAGGVNGAGRALTVDECSAHYQPAREVGKLLEAEQQLKFVPSTDAAAVVAALR